jgi:hypothetical protein
MTRLGDTERKEMKRLNLVFTAMVVGVYLLNFVFDTQIQDSAATGSGLQKVLAHILYGAGIAALWLTDKYIPYFLSKIPPKGLGFGLPILGLSISAIHAL